MTTVKKRRSNLARTRSGCASCKIRKKKCDEMKPRCSACVRLNTDCSYSVKLNWLTCNQKVLVGEILEASQYTENYHFLISNPHDIQLYMYLQGTIEFLDPSKQIMKNRGIHRNRVSTESVLDLDIESKLFEYYVEVISKKKVFSDSELNEFRSIIIPGCITSPSLFHSIMAFSASDILRQDLNKFNYYSALITKYKNEAINLMYNLLDNPDIKCMKAIVITLLVLCSLEIGEKGNDSWVSFLKEACMIMESLPEEKILSSEDLLFGYRYFALRYILLLTTFSRKQFIQFTTQTPFSLIAEFFKSDDVDYMFGCSPHLLKMVHGITVLKNKVERFNSPEVVTEIKQLYSELKNLKQNNKEGQRLANCSRIYYNTTILYFINCFNQYVDIKIDTSHMIDECLHIFYDMFTDNQTHSLFPTWSLFIIAVSNINDDTEKFRVKVLDIFDHMEVLWPLGSVTIIRNTVELIWKNIDLNSDDTNRDDPDWRDVLNTMFIKLPLT